VLAPKCTHHARLGKIREVGVHRRAEHYYQQLDALRPLRQEVRLDLSMEGKKHKAWKLLRQIPGIGPIRAALLIVLLQTPHRFRTKRQLWTNSSLGFQTVYKACVRRDSGTQADSDLPPSCHLLFDGAGVFFRSFLTEMIAIAIEAVAQCPICNRAIE
jgi:hypothetical protein